MLPYDRDNSRNFYTIELRTPQNFDRGIGQVIELKEPYFGSETFSQTFVSWIA